MKLPALYMKILAKTVTLFMLARQTRPKFPIKRAPKSFKQQKPENSASCEHVILFDHVIDWANSRILKTESNFSKTLTAEFWFILSRPRVINRSDGESFPIVYRSLL